MKINYRSFFDCFVIFPFLGGAVMAMGAGLVCFLLNLSTTTRTHFSTFVVVVFGIMGFLQGIWYGVSVWRNRNKYK